MKEIYNPICYSLYTDNVYSEDCLKRVFYANDLITGEDIRIFVCAEYFRLVFDKHNRDKYSFALEKTLDETIGEYIPLWDKWDVQMKNLYKRSSSNSFENINISLTILERPRRSITIPIYDAMGIVLKNKTNCTEIKCEIANRLIYWSEQKTLKKDITLLSLIRKTFNINGIKKNKNKYYYSDFSYNTDIDENAFIELTLNLFNKLK